MALTYDDERVIRPNIEHQWTKEMIQEYTKCAKSSTYFALNHAVAIHPIKGIIPLEVRDYQLRLLDSLQHNQLVLGLQGRQTGKCVFYDTEIKLKNKKTGDIITTTIGEFFDSLEE